jgi:hypothetical protein
VISGITGKTSGVVLGVLMPALTLASSVVVSLAVVGMLLLVDAAIAITAATGFALAYLAITAK